MIVTKEFKNIKQIQFDTMSIDTTTYTIKVNFDNTDNQRVISIIELYSVVKQMWIEYSDSLMMYPFPFEYLTDGALTFNKPWQLLIQ